MNSIWIGAIPRIVITWIRPEKTAFLAVTRGLAFQIEGAPGRVQFRLAVVRGDHVLNVWRKHCKPLTEGKSLGRQITMKNP